MTKRDIVKFLKSKHLEKKAELFDINLKRREQIYSDTYSMLGLPALAGQIQPLLTEALRLWVDWKKEHESYDGLIFNFYDSLEDSLSAYTSSDSATYDKITSSHLNLNSEEQRNSWVEYDERMKRVDDTFNAVFATVREIKSAEKAATYLKELGFDLSELETSAAQSPNTLTAPIDIRDLLVQAAA